MGNPAPAVAHATRLLAAAVGSQAALDFALASGVHRNPMAVARYFFPPAPHIPKGQHGRLIREGCRSVSFKIGGWGSGRAG
ncbi:hypothetical protein MMPV_010058 [Pyropia vietnamensis]